MRITLGLQAAVFERHASEGTIARQSGGIWRGASFPSSPMSIEAVKGDMTIVVQK
jgi:hypothetical protein